MSDDDLDKLAAEMKNIRASDDARERGMAAAMAAFDMEFETEKSSAIQGLESGMRPTGQTTYTEYVKTLGRDTMSKLSELLTFKPKTAMMMGSCAVALFATSLYLPNTTFEDNMAIKPGPEAIMAEVETDRADEVVVTGKRAEATQTQGKKKLSEIQGVELEPTLGPMTPPKKVASDTQPKAQGGINSIDALLDKVRADSVKTPAENQDREAKFRQRQNEQASLFSPTSEDQKRAIREYRAALQQRDNSRLFIEQQDISTPPSVGQQLPNQGSQPAPVPPMIERQQAAKPSERLALLDGAIAEFEAPKVDRQSFKIQISDRDVQPLLRIPPIMPVSADKSGHCTLRYDVNSEGIPVNVIATKCTESIFESASVKSVKKWKYNPKIVNGRAIGRSGVESKVSFRNQLWATPTTWRCKAGGND